MAEEEVVEIYNNPELHPHLHQFPSKIPFSECDSPSRRNMVFSQMSQHVVVKGSEIPGILTGSEIEYGKYTHAVTLPCDAVIRKIINKYPKERKRDSINPLTVVIYENIDKPGHFGLLEIPHYFALHYQFGFEYKRTDAFDNIQINKTVIPKGTRLAQSPTIADNGVQKLGVELNAIFVTSYDGIEDGCAVDDEIHDALSTKCYQTIKFQFGRNSFPINLWGDDKVYKCIPEIGERISTDALIAAVRPSDEILNAVTTDPYSLMEYDFHDRLVFANQPNARVVDVTIIKTNVKNSAMLTGMDVQLERYHQRNMSFYQAIYDEYRQIKKEIKNPQIDPEFGQYLRTALALFETKDPRSDQILTAPKAPLDQWSVTIKVEYDLPSDEGSKLTDLHGGKVVMTSVKPKENMYVDEYGVRAQIVLLDEASLNRMNVGRDHERAVGVVRLRLRQQILDRLGDKKELSPEDLEWAWERLLKLYWCVSEAFYYDVKNHSNPKKHVQHVIDDKIRVGRQLNEGRPAAEMLQLLEDNFDIRGTKVTYVNNAGKTVTTKNPCLIAPLQFIVLDKVSDVAAATASAKMQHFNTPANLRSEDKTSTPYRDNATKIMGETESMLVLGTTRKGTYAETLDQTTNAVAHTEVAYSVLSADNPMDIERAVDRSQVPLVGGRTTAVATHLIQCSGIDVKHREED